MKIDEDVLLIAGPTASGKTALAIQAAQESDAIIINADSMQVYSDLRIVSARPSEDEEAKAPHFLFGHVDGAEAYSVARWLEDVRPFMTGSARKRIFVGGTGLYFNSLLEGISPVPEIDAKTREKWRVASQLITAPELHKELVRLDPDKARTLRESDTQRVVRALEVIESTGRSLAEWQTEKGEAVLPSDMSIRKVLLMPDRAVLHQRINQRFDMMLEAGALDEVRQLLQRGLDPVLPVMKAIGVPQLLEVVNGETSLDEACERAKAASRQYAKRQSTWFRNSLGEGWELIS
ncbi:MAG: tRNA (adenosine(37)-N6)-dimethylallyltransferase MiaA [Pseudomonadota bacterium]